MIEVARIAETTLALQRPLRLGAAEFSSREYAGLQITDGEGRFGTSYALTRNAPLAMTIERLFRPLLDGFSVSDPCDVWDRLYRATALAGRVGISKKALGLVDIAVWDLIGQRAGEPVWKLLGTGDAPRPSILVAAYPTADASVGTLVDEVMTAASDGWSYIKIARSPDPRLMRALLSELQSQLPDRTQLVIDAGFVWANAEEALREVEQWRIPSKVAWLEDPFLPEEVEHCVRLRASSEVPIGAGDEVTDPRVLRALMESGAVDVLRVDVVALGGITPAIGILTEAAGRGIMVSTHVYPEVSVHLGVMTETFDREVPAATKYDPAATLIVGGPEFDAGWVAPPQLPGLGFDLRWDLFA